MPQLIQRFPRALMGALGIPTANAPSALADQVVPIVDAGRYYTDSAMVRATVTNSSFAPVALGPNPMSSSQFLTNVSLPQGNNYLYGLSLQSSAAALGGQGFDYQLYVEGATTGLVTLTDRATYAGGAARFMASTGARFFATPLLVQPDDRCGIWIHSITVAPTLTFFGTVYFTTQNP